MKNLLAISILVVLASCEKQKDAMVPQLPPCGAQPMERPSLTISYAILSSTEVQLTWQKKGKETYTVQRKESGGDWVNVKTCQCNYARDIIKSGVTYLYRVLAGNNISNVITVSTTPPPPVPDRVIKVSFDEYKVTYWNAFLQDTTLLGSGLDVWQREYIMDQVRVAFAQYNITFVHFGSAAQTCVVTQSDEWFGSAGGVAYVGSYGTGKECFVFSKLLSYHWQNITKAIIHELGHALGLYHTKELYVGDNWMNYIYALYQRFYEVIDASGSLVNQPQVIENTLQ